MASAIVGASLPPNLLKGLGFKKPLGLIWGNGRHGNRYGRARVVLIKAYKEEKTNSVSNFFSKVIGALPGVGLIARLLSDEGGIGGDRLQFAEFCSKVGRNSTQETSLAFSTFEERHGKVAKPQFVLIWCWAAAVGAGLLKSEDIMLSALRLRIQYDILFEEENLNLLMDEATEKRKKSRSPLPNVPLLARAEKALQAICKCCIGSDQIQEEDAELLCTILSVVFPTLDVIDIQNILNARLKDMATEVIKSDDQWPVNEESEKRLNGANSYT